MDDSTIHKYVYSQSHANNIKKLLDDLRNTDSQSRQKQIRSKLRSEYKFKISDFWPNFTSADFDDLIKDNVISIAKDSSEEKVLYHQATGTKSILTVQESKNGSKFVNCPVCTTPLHVTPELFSSTFISCPVCHCDFKNPIETQRFKHKLIWVILGILFFLWIVGKMDMQSDAGKTKTFEQIDRTEIYYHDDNGNVIKRKTIYKDGRPTEMKYY